MINPEIQGVDYQHGQTYGYEETRYFVFARDEYICQACHRKNQILHTHHIIYRSEGGTDRADNLITVCTDCHTSANHKPGGIFWKWMKEGKKSKQYKAPTFMNILRQMTFKKYPDAEFTYGSETTPRRKELGLEKTHYNDAIAITGVETIKENSSDCFWIKQFRKKKRSLHEAIPRKGRKVKNVEAKRNSKNTKQLKGHFLNDEVICFGKRGWISGFNNSGAYIKDMQDNYIQIPNKTYKVVSFVNIHRCCHNNNWQYQTN